VKSQTTQHGDEKSKDEDAKRAVSHAPKTIAQLRVEVK
jgi:hypothetical protein